MSCDIFVNNDCKRNFPTDIPDSTDQPPDTSYVFSNWFLIKNVIKQTTCEITNNGREKFNIAGHINRVYGSYFIPMWVRLGTNSNIKQSV